MNNFQSHKVDKVKSLQKLMKIFNDDIYSYQFRLNDVGKKATNESDLAEIIKLERRMNEYVKKLQAYSKILDKYDNIANSFDLNSPFDIFPQFISLDEEFLEIRQSLYTIISNLKN